MSGTINSIREVAPLVGVVAGEIIGTYREYAIQKKLAIENQPLNEQHADIVAQQPKESKRSQIARYAIGPVAVACAMAGGVIGLAWQTEGEADQKSKIQLIVDRSGATDIPDGESSLSTPASRINGIVEEFADHKETATKILVGQGGDVVERSSSDLLKNVRPFGNAPMPKAVSLSIEGINSTYTSTSEKDSKTANAIVVLTNGNPFGKAEDVIQSAKASDIAISVKDVSDSTDAGEVKSMREIAVQTGGVYLDNTAKPEDIYDAVKDQAQANSPDQQTGDKHGTPEKILSLLALVGAYGIGRQRQKMSYTINGSKIEK